MHTGPGRSTFFLPPSLHAQLTALFSSPILGLNLATFTMMSVRSTLPVASAVLLALLATPLVNAAEGNAAARYEVEFEVQLTSKERGKFIMEVHPEWAPLGKCWACARVCCVERCIAHVFRERERARERPRADLMAEYETTAT